MNDTPLETTDAAARMEHSAKAIEAILRGLDEELAHWRPGTPEQGRWSIVEVVGHLADEEREDFRVRVDYALHRPDDPFPPLDPKGRVVEARFQERSLEEALADYLVERKLSVEWLRDLGDADLSREHAAPWGGTITAGDVLASWVVHDLLHLKQVARILYERMKADAEPFGLEYAGPWR